MQVTFSFASIMAVWLRQIRLLLWKNFILQIRRPIGTAFEIILPVALSAVLIIARVQLSDESTDKCFSTFDAEKTSRYENSFNFPGAKFTFFPDSGWARKIANSSAFLRRVLVNRDLNGKIFTSEESAAREAAENPDDYLGALIFQDVSSGSLPKQVSYKIRRRTNFADTSRVYPAFQSPGPQTYSDYSFEFMPLQWGVDKAIVEMHTNQSSLTVADKLTQFPYPSYKVDTFINIVKSLMPILFLIAFIYTAVCIIREIVREKKEGLKEAMKMMGLSNWVHWFCWFLKNFVFLTISCVFLTILLKAANIFAYADGVLLFVFFLTYSVAVISFCFAISVFCCNVICGMLVGALLWIATYVPYAVIATGTNTKYDVMTVTQKAAVCLLPNTCLGIGIQVLAKLEVAQVGSNWQNFHQPSSIDENFSLLLVMVMFLVQSVMWWIITWYVEAVFPGEFGVPKPFYFFLTPSYWCGSSSSCRAATICDEDFEMNEKDYIADVEKAPDGCEVGIKIHDLTKVFKSATGKKIAVNGLNLTVYKGQITALLGHNGAGKTTTMSILTGLYTATSGSAIIAGKDIRKNMDEIRESLGLCPQHNILFDRLTVQEHLEFFIALKGITGKEAKMKIDEMLNDLILANKRNAKSMTLSGGMKRKLCCAIALIGNPDVVFLDEPTSGMDAYARRATWDLLEKHAVNKTVILTTHFMDEADYLGDRIAIMADGELRCCGSSLYLKKKYGVGYHMTLVKTDQFQAETTNRLIVNTVPSAKIDSDGQTEVSYVLEHSESPKFRNLFEKLEASKEKLGLRSFGISVTTMEEVFLKVGEGSAKAFPDGVLPNPSENTMKKICDHKEMLSGMALSFSQFRAMFTKRFLNSKREKKAVITQLLLPLLVMLTGLALNLVVTTNNDQPPLVLDLSMLSQPDENTFAYVADYRNVEWQKWTKHVDNYFKGVRVSKIDITTATKQIKKQNMNNSITFKGKTYTLSKSDRSACCNYKDLVLNAKCQVAVGTVAGYKQTCGSNDKKFGYSPCTSCIESQYDSRSFDCPMTISKTDLNDSTTFYQEYVLEESNAKRFFNKYVAGVTFKNITKKWQPKDFEINAWYSGQALHNLPSVFSAVNNIILRYLKSDDSYGIKTINHPLPLSKKEKQRQISEGPDNIVMIIFATLTATSIAASFVVFIVTEKKSKAKHIQFVSGVNGVIYWLSSFCWDFLSYLIPAIALIISFAAFQNSFVAGESLAALSIMTILYGLAVIPFMYLISFVFKSPFAAYAVTAIIGFGVCVGMFFAVFICRFPGLSCNSDAKIMHKAFLLIPMYGFSVGVLDIRTNSLNRAQCKLDPTQCTFKEWQSSSFDVNYPGVGLTCIYFIIECIIYLGLVILIEENFFIKRQPSPPPPRPQGQYEDPDVTDEKRRVACMPMNEVQNSAVVMKELTKVYRSNNVRAVDGVSVGIPTGECFGLLGVNGAGKTTTFSMLTGELGITSGTAYLSGFNIQTQLREVQQRIGYCPQFDALIGNLTGREMLEMFARLRGIPSHKIPDVVNAVIHDLHLEEYSDKMCGTYSGGNKRKLSTAIALVGDPPIVFLDEPTSGMDPVSRRFLWNTLKGVLDSTRSIILTSHSMEECEALCNRLVIMVNGEFKCVGGLQHIKSRYGQGYTMMIKVGDRSKERRRSSMKRGSVLKPKFNRSFSDGEGDVMVDNEMLSFNQVDGQVNSIQIEEPSAIQQATERVKFFIAQHVPDSLLLEQRPGMLEYQIRNPDIPLSFLFGMLEDNADDLRIIDYSLSQTTLEQVFINFAKSQRDEAPKKKKRCCCCSC